MNKSSTIAPYISALTAGVVGGLSLVLNDIIFFQSGFSFLLLFSGLFGFLAYGSMGLLFASILLIPLKPIFRKYSLSISCVVFLNAGIVVPLLLQHGLNQFHAHGIDPYSREEKWNTITRMIAICSIGGVSSFSAWFTLKMERISGN